MAPPIGHIGDCPHAETIASLGQKFDGLSSKVDTLADDLAGNCEDTATVKSDTKRVLELLQGPDPLKDPEGGLVATVNRHERTHKLAHRALIAAVMAAATSIGSWFHFGSK